MPCYKCVLEMCYPCAAICHLATKTVSREPKGGLRDLETSLRELQTDLPIREMLKRADRVLRTG